MNQYLQEFEELQEKDTFRGQQWFGERQRLVEEYSWAVPNEDAIRYLSQFEHLTSVGAGRGYWEHLVSRRDGSVTAFDIDPPDNTYTHVAESPAHEYFDIIEDSPVLMVWPPCDVSVSHRVIKQNPSHVVYVGEEKGGCTGTSQFFHELRERYGLVEEIEIPSYEGVNDSFYHYARKM